MQIFENSLTIMLAFVYLFAYLPVILMAQTPLKTPGVYIVEKNAFPNSIVEVATAVPAFIGYTEKAVDGKRILKNKPTRLTSLAEYERYFGGAPDTKYNFTARDSGAFKLEVDSAKYNLYYGMKFFFANGGGSCYIVSVGSYSDSIAAKAILGNPEGGLNSLVKEPEPTMIVIPDAVLLDIDGWQTVSQSMIQHCGELQNRIAILDVYEGYRKSESAANSLIIPEVKEFRDRITSTHLSYGVSYYPWLNTSIVDKVSFLNIANPGALVEPLSAEAAKNYPGDKGAQILPEIQKLNDSLTVAAADSLHEILIAISPFYKEIMLELKRQENLQPPSAGIAGVYTSVDNSQGVWKAPANVSLSSVLSPAVNINQSEQEDLNAPLDGKAVNAIRTFPGQGTLIWGARTLDGNSLDWRYISVRRTIIMLEQSIQNAAKAYVFEPNTEPTWVSVSSMISNFLTDQWKQGALMGSKPEDAFFVKVGLGTTMTAQDILDGYMRIEIGVAVTRPAEFIIVSFVQEMAGS